MHILIITLFYAPDIGPSAPLFTSLSEETVQLGHEVSVIAAVPHFSTGKIEPGFRGFFIRTTIENGVNITRIPIPSLNRAKLINRLIQFICFQFGATLATLTKKFDIALIVNPAIETLLPFIWQAIIRRKPTIWSVFDVYPDVGIKLGIFKSKAIIGIVSFLEQICLKFSTRIHIISNTFKPGLRQLGVEDSRMSLIPIWVDTNLIRPMSKQNKFAQTFEIDHHFVVLYAGNIGLSQGLENVITAAEILKEHGNLKFVFVGNGTGLKDLQKMVQNRMLSNVQFIPFQPRERLPEVLASANTALVILKHGIGKDSLPSKIFSSLASGRPIIASVDPESEAWNLIQQYNAGICVPPEDPHQISESILKLMANSKLCTQLGSNGRKCAENYHSVLSATKEFEKLFFIAFNEKKSRLHIETRL